MAGAGAMRAGSDSAAQGASFDAAWEAVRADDDIQFAPVAAKADAEPPGWWADFIEALSDVLGPVGQGIAAVWPWLQYALLALLIVAAAVVLWRFARPYLDRWRTRDEAPEADVAPEPAAARRLLDEADALAAAGRYEQAAHLLLHRSVEDIRGRRPDLLRPSTTAREIGAADALPERARAMFAVISDQVERAVFAARPIGEDGWRASRDAYEAFALRSAWRAA